MNEVRIDRLVLDIPEMHPAAARDVAAALAQHLAAAGRSADVPELSATVEHVTSEPAAALASRIAAIVLQRIG